MTTKTHIALYRKYRPQSFDDVVGQEHLVELLKSTIKQKKTAHAYLFCGGRGTGKTTVARIFARDIGCNPEDIIEIDAASNRGIDEIRELREAVRTAPFSSEYKVYIIDEAHMLTKEAANALLKTLEEPPTHVIFILATTDPEKLPQTIVSRCQKIIFKQPDLATLAKRLSYVAEEEGKKMEEETAMLLARHGKGSYRDALGVLEQVLALSVKDVEHTSVVAFLGAPDKELLMTLLTLVCSKDAKKLLEIVDKLAVSTTSALRSYDEYIELVRTGLRIRIGDTEVANEELAKLATTYPHAISSKTILELLEKRHLLLVQDEHAWTAFLAIMLSLMND